MTIQGLKELRELPKETEVIEFKKPNYYISLKVAQNTGKKAVYTKTKGFDKSYYLALILKAIKQHNSLTRKDMDGLLWEKLPNWMDESQKRNKVGNLLSELRMEDKIENLKTYDKNLKNNSSKRGCYCHHCRR